MPRQFRLKSQHYINDMLLEEGTVVGEGTEIPFPGLPSVEMEGLDEASQKEVEEVQAKGWGINPSEALPSTLDGTVAPPGAKK